MCGNVNRMLCEAKSSSVETDCHNGARKYHAVTVWWATPRAGWLKGLSRQHVEGQSCQTQRMQLSHACGMIAHLMYCSKHGLGSVSLCRHALKQVLALGCTVAVADAILVDPQGWIGASHTSVAAAKGTARGSGQQQQQQRRQYTQEDACSRTNSCVSAVSMLFRSIQDWPHDHSRWHASTTAGNTIQSKAGR